MAKFGQGFINSLINPSYGEGLMQVAQQAGALPSELIKAKKDAEREEKFRQIMQMGTAAIGTQDPTNLARTAQALMNIPGYEKQAVEFATMAQQANTKMQKQQAIVNTANSLAERADKLGLSEVAKSARGTRDESLLADINEDITKEELARLPATVAVSRARLKAAGFNPDDYDVGSLTKEEVTDIVSGAASDVEAWTTNTGETVAARVSKNGLVMTKDTGGKFVLPNEAGLVKRAPQVSEVLNTSQKFIDGLGDQGLKDFIELRDGAQGASEKIMIIDRQLSRLENMPTGFGAELGLAFRRVGQFMGLPYDPQVTNAQEFLIEAAKFVKEEINAFGAGTGLSDKDREFTEKMVAGNITNEREALEGILNIYRRGAVRAIDNYNSVRKDTAKRVGEQNMATFGTIGVPTGKRFEGFSVDRGQ